MVTLTQLAFPFRTPSPGFPKISLGHAQQLVAAALGHNSLAALQNGPYKDTSLDPDSFYWLDIERFRQRVTDLQIDCPPDQVFARLLASFHTHLPHARFYFSFDELVEELGGVVGPMFSNHDVVQSHIASTNSFGVDEYDFTVSLDTACFAASMQGIAAPDLWIPVTGVVLLDADSERPFSGDRVDVVGQVLVKLTGARSLSIVDIEVGKARVRGWADPDVDELPSADMALTGADRESALAIALGISNEDAAEILCLDPVIDESEDGLMYGLIYMLENEIPDELQARILTQHGSLSFRVMPWDEDFSTLEFY